MLAYLYDPITREYIGTQVAQKDPLDGGYLLPAHSTFKEPPNYGKFQIPVYSDNDNWIIATDYRGCWQVKLTDMTFSKVEHIGDILPGYQKIEDRDYERYQEDPDRYAIVDGKFTDISGTQQYQDIKTKRREIEFKNNFFEVPDFGWYRRVPKGYNSAVESMNTAFNAVTLLQKLPEKTLLFYTAPDFRDPDQCTEEWLVAHSFYNIEMTVQEFSLLYMKFMTAWNEHEHELEVSKSLANEVVEE